MKILYIAIVLSILVYSATVFAVGLTLDLSLSLGSSTSLAPSDAVVYGSDYILYDADYVAYQ